MILPAINTLLYAVNRSSDQHAVALKALREGFDDRAASPWPGRCCWLSCASRCAAAYSRDHCPSTMPLRVIEHWLRHSRSQVVHPGERHAEILGQLLKSAGTAGNLTTDAHLAALAVEHGATILSFDRNFTRFEGVRWTLPTAD